VRRLRPSDWGVLAGSAGLLVTLFMKWYEPDGNVSLTQNPAGTLLNTTGWSALGWFTVLLLALCIALGLLLVVLLAAGVGDWGNLPPGVALFALTPPALIVLLIVVLLQPGLGYGLPNDAVAMTTAGRAGVGLMVLLTVCASASIHDERRNTYGRTATPPTPRPAPPA
jgi:hypothetical protein